MTIYEPAEDSFLLAHMVKHFVHGSVLDIGTGSGIQAKTAASLKKVRSVTAVDINSEAIAAFKKEIKSKKIKKIAVLKSDLFSNVRGKFDTIVFNPPYLPLDEREPHDSRLATTGGKHGYETLQRFLQGVDAHLAQNGMILIVFSSLTKKEKVDDIIEDMCYEKECIAQQTISFETLYVYKIRRSILLDSLMKKKMTDVRALMKGHRGMVYTGRYKNKKVAIKMQRADVAVETIDFESGVIQKINRKGIAPKLCFKGKNYFVYDFAEGEFIIDFLEYGKRQETKKILLEVLRQCRILDKLHISKEEMHNPYKHVIIGKKVVLIDFERAHYDRYPHNVTQFCQYIMRNDRILREKGIMIEKNALINAAQQYKKNQSESNYAEIQNLIAE